MINKIDKIVIVACVVLGVAFVSIWIVDAIYTRATATPEYSPVVIHTEVTADDEQQAWDYLMGELSSETASAAVMGNIMQNGDGTVTLQVAEEMINTLKTEHLDCYKRLVLYDMSQIAVASEDIHKALHGDYMESTTKRHVIQYAESCFSKHCKNIEDIAIVATATENYDFDERIEMMDAWVIRQGL